MKPIWDGLEHVKELADKVARTSSTVLLLGDTGTGKEVVSYYIHSRSLRAGHSFVVADLSTKPKDLVDQALFGHVRGSFTGAAETVPGWIERADGGTLFLDEIGEVPPEVQVKLLGFLTRREYEQIGGRTPQRADVRIIAATNTDLEAAVDNKKFRDDLLQRLWVAAIRLPNLRSRGRDSIVRLAGGFVQVIAHNSGRSQLCLSPDAIDLLCAHDWPGNVRELENTIERASVFCDGDVIHARDITFTRRRVVPDTTIDVHRADDAIELIGERLGNLKERPASFRKAVFGLAERLIGQVQGELEGEPKRRLVRRVMKMGIREDALLLDEIAYAVALFISWDVGRDEMIVTPTALKNRYSSTFNKPIDQLGPLHRKIRDLLVDPRLDVSIR